MTSLPRLERILSTEIADGVELVVQSEGGETYKFLATREQIQRFIKELGAVDTLADNSE